MLLNISINARDAMPGGGDLVFSTGNYTVDHGSGEKFPEADAGDYVRISVSDNGTGIGHETRKHIFEPFYTTKEKG